MYAAFWPVGNPLANNILGGWVITGLSWCWKIIILGLLIRNAWFLSSWEIFRSSGVLHLIVHMRVHCKSLHQAFDFGEYPQDPPLLSASSILCTLTPSSPHEFYNYRPTHFPFHYIHNCSPEKLRCNRGAFSWTHFHDFVPTVANPNLLSFAWLCWKSPIASLVWRYLIMACTFCVVLWKCFE